MRRSCLPLLILLIGFLFIAGWLGLKGFHIYQAALALQTNQTQAEGLLEQGITNINPDDAETLLNDIRANVTTIERETALFMPLAPRLGWVPKLGPSLVASPQLLKMATAGTDSAAYALRALKPSMEIVQANSGLSALTGVLQTLEDGSTDLQQSATLLDEVATARAEIPNEAELPWTVRQLLPKADEYLPLAQDGLALSRVLPAIAGTDSPRRYLIIAQNENELRPSGGFISGVGLLTVFEGQIMDLQFLDANIVDDWANKPYDAPPYPLEYYMGLELFLFRDANFWADFPTSAETAMQLYSYGQDVALPDGAIAVNQQFVINLIKTIGVVNLADSGDQITPNNVEEWIKSAWGSGEDGTLGKGVDRKAFIGLLASALRNKVENNPGSLDPFALAELVQNSAESKDLQIYMRDESSAEVLRDVGWDGAIVATAGNDLLMLVETNLGYNKANLNVDRLANYSVQLQSDGYATAELTWTIENRNPVTTEPCRHNDARYSADLTYLDLAVDCYWNYGRLYTPFSTQLLSAQSQPIDSLFFDTSNHWDGVVRTIPDPTGLTVFEDFWLVAQNEVESHRYSYQLPKVVQVVEDGSSQYRLNLLKQAGVAPYAVTINVQLPDGAQLLESTPAGIINNNIVTFEVNLNQDLTFIVSFQ